MERAHASGRTGLGTPACTHSCRSRVHRYPHFCRRKCCCSWPPKSPRDKAGGSVSLWETAKGHLLWRTLPTPPQTGDLDTRNAHPSSQPGIGSVHEQGHSHQSGHSHRHWRNLHRTAPPWRGRGGESRLVSPRGATPSPPPGRRAVVTHRAGKLAVSSVPPRGTSAGSSLGAAGSLVGTLATGIAAEAPGARGTGHGAVTTLPT